MSVSTNSNVSGIIDNSIVVITGTAGSGSTLTAVLTSGYTASGYQWIRDGVDIGGATSSTYAVQNIDAGKTLTVRVTGLVKVSNGVITDPRTLRTTFVQSAGRAVMGQTTSGYLTGYTRYNSRRRVDIKGEALVDPKAVFSSFVIKSTGYAAAPNALTLSAAIEYAGVSYPLLFGGLSTVSISSAANWVTSDAITGLTIPVDATAYMRQEYTVASSAEFVPAGEFVYPATYAIEQVILGGTNSQVSAVGAMTAAASGGGTLAGFANEMPYSAMALIGQQPVLASKSILGIGMSITDGVVASYDTVPDAVGNVGWFAKGAYAAGIPFTKLTRGSNRAMWCIPAFAGDAYTALMASSSHVVLDIFTNDIANGSRTLANIQADCLTLATAARSAGAKVYVVKIIPRTSASNVPITNFAPGGIRDQFNEWLDTKAADGTIDGVINFNSLMEFGSTGTWQDFSSQTYEGVHPKPAMFTSMTSLFQTVAASW